MTSSEGLHTHTHSRTPGSFSRALDAIRARVAAWLVPGPTVKCTCCGANLIEVSAISSASKVQPPPFWRIDTREILVRCRSCKHFHAVYAYPIFNWIPASRLATEVAFLNLLVLMLILAAAMPRPIVDLISA